MNDEILLTFNEEGKAELYEPYKTVYFDTEADFLFVQEAIGKQTAKFVNCQKGFQGMRDTRYYCPTCKNLTRQREEYCHNCGQKVKYPKEVFDRENNRFVLDWSEK